MSERPEADNDFSLTLESNASDSLGHAADHLSHYKTDSDLKFAVLHITHALELFVKAYLASQHPMLVYVKPEDGKTSNTVSLDIAIKRAIECGADISPKDLALVHRVRGIRNQIEHHHFRLNKANVENLVMQVLEMLDGFLKRYSKHSIDDIVTTPNYLKIVENLASYAERVKQAESRASEMLPDGRDGDHGDLLYCDECGLETVPATGTGDAKCVNCGAQFTVEDCSRCGHYYVVSGDQPSLMCPGCWEYVTSKDD